MTEIAPEPGPKTRKERVKFGDKPTQNIPHEWAEYIIQQLYRTKKTVWVKLLPEAAEHAGDRP